ncbi:hypothetical protein, partial [Burkholderia pseudomallei]|uniref:hypothetical protein n=1 Tax=Burkholderia pseudomallei TaxID=28450 RepID=UPI001C3E4AF9
RHFRHDRHYRRRATQCERARLRDAVDTFHATVKVRSSIAIAAADHERTPRFILRRGEPLGTAERLAVTAA